MAFFLLLEDGASRLMLEDGTSRVLLESADAGFRSVALLELGGIEAPGAPSAGQPTIRRYETTPHMGGRRRFAAFG